MLVDLMEIKIRLATKQIMKEMKSMAVGFCNCGVTAVHGCRRCYSEITEWFLRACYNYGICTAKWINLKQIPAGT
ncbi:hypothetical protein Hanom_Chr09g00805931 [Helianthus anomalus]